VGGRVVVVGGRVVVVLGCVVVVVWGGVVRVVPVPATVVLVLVAGTVLEELVVVTGTAAVLAMKLLTIVAVQVTVLAPAGPDPLHWSMVVGSPVLWEGGAVAVQVIVPPGPPEELHCVSLWPPGPPEPAWLLPGGTAVHVSVVVKSGFRHWLTVAAIAAPVGYPLRLFVTVAVQVTVLAPPRPEALHWVIPVTGFTELVVLEIPHTTGAVQAMSVVIVANPVGSAGVAALYVKLLTTVIVQVIVLPPTVPALLHSESPMPWALAWLAPPPTIVRPSATVKQKQRTIPSEKVRIFERAALLWVVTGLLSVVRSGSATGSSTRRATLSPSCQQAPTVLSVDW